MFRITTFIVLIALSLPGIQAQDESCFYAYYTRINSGEAFEEHARVGETADVVVNLGDDRKVVFWRGSSYLPFLQSGDSTWYLDEVIPRSGDGTRKMPDIHNRYSYVRIIENQPERVVVHWRYVHDFSNPAFTGAVDEYFTFTPDMMVERKVRKGTGTIDEWEDPASVFTQSIRLGSDGMEERTRKTPRRSTGQSHNHNSWNEGSDRTGDAMISFGFNESAGSSTLESVQNQIIGVAGHRALWKRGISGSCLQFDGYYSSVALPGNSTQEIGDEITLEGWIAPGAYPFDWGPLVHQSSWGQSGFYLGLDQQGRSGFHVALDGNWHSLVSDSALELFKWHYIAGTLNKKGEMVLYVNGKQVNSSSPGPGSITLNNSDLMIGLNSDKLPMGPGRLSKGKYPSLFGFDGLIDEVKVFQRAKTPSEIIDRFRSISNVNKGISGPDMEYRHWPVWDQEPAQTGFGAHYSKLTYYETWDHMWRVSDHPDVVVTFDEMPCRIVSWRGLSNGPVLVTENNLWVGDQSSENYKELDAEGEAEGCCEHMSDKQCRHAHIRIIENTPARVVLHYRYGMVDSRYIFPDIDPETGWGDWADEIWTIYPDGVAVRHLERGMIWGDSWVETMFFSAPGQKPEDVVETEAFTVVGEDEKAETWSWEDGSPDQVFKDISITMVNTRSKYRAFNVYPSGSSVEVFGGHSRGSKFHWWNHWPVSQITSDGRGARAADRAAHSSLVWGIPEEEFLMYGLTNKTPEELIPLARSWNSPPKIRKLLDAESYGYRQEQRAYSLRKEGDIISFELKGSEASPVLNPCFLVKNWADLSHAMITVEGKEVSAGSDCRQGLIRDTDGSITLVVWLQMEKKSAVRIEIAGNTDTNS